MLRKYIIVCNRISDNGKGNVDEKIFVVTKEEYYKKLFFAEPITDSDDRLEAERLSEHIQKIGVQQYLDDVRKKADSFDTTNNKSAQVPAYFTQEV